MPNPLLHTILIFSAAASFLVAQAAPSPPAPHLTQQQSTPEQGATPQPPSQGSAPAQIPPPAQAPPAHPGPLIILDPGHGGSDTGARGPGGAVEKEAALMIARIVRIELERQGYRVAMTRNDDTNPSYNDRAAVANSHRDAIFISIHISTTGTIGTAHTYYYRFASPLIPAAASNSNPAPPPPAPQTGGLALWEDAQQPYTESSRHFADILELELAERFPGSPATSSPAAVRELRSVALPAVAVELSNVGVTDSRTLISMAPPLATAIERSVDLFRAQSAAGAN
ncbi:MAG: N-acetylmuramoyl-L-alanine amidase [Candidatus Acidiferrales bacterium]